MLACLCANVANVVAALALMQAAARPRYRVTQIAIVALGYVGGDLTGHSRGKEKTGCTCVLHLDTQSESETQHIAERRELILQLLLLFSPMGLTYLMFRATKLMTGQAAGCENSLMKLYVHYEDGPDESELTLKLTLPKKWVSQPISQVLEVSAPPC